MIGWMRRLLLVAAACLLVVAVAGAPTPASAMDAAVEDAGTEDAGTEDAGTEDAGADDAAGADASDFHPAVDDGGCRVAGGGSRGGVLALLLSAALLGFSGRRSR
jgi:hypothetical protein